MATVPVPIGGSVVAASVVAVAVVVPPFFTVVVMQAMLVTGVFPAVVRTALVSWMAPTVV
jgi:hypothetical protein